MNIVRQIWAYRGLSDHTKWSITVAYLTAKAGE